MCKCPLKVSIVMYFFFSGKYAMCNCPLNVNILCVCMFQVSMFGVMVL